MSDRADTYRHLAALMRDETRNHVDLADLLDEMAEWETKGWATSLKALPGNEVQVRVSKDVDA
jgi:hypothetical protein